MKQDIHASLTRCRDSPNTSTSTFIKGTTWSWDSGGYALFEDNNPVHHHVVPHVASHMQISFNDSSKFCGVALDMGNISGWPV